VASAGTLLGAQRRRSPGKQIMAPPVGASSLRHRVSSWCFVK
jgi:hypothetical protein